MGNKRTMFKEKGDEWCEVTIELRERDGGPELSICGSFGRIETREDAEVEARQYWIDFFEEDDAEFGAFVKRFPGEASTPEEAAALVLCYDGELHGMDVHAEDGDKVYLLIGCGQCVDEIRAWFPEVAPYLRYHLNGMNAGCEHQRALDETPAVSEPCAVCGYEYGSRWLHEDLPADVIEWAMGEG
jgi:hypothetical protein